MLRRAALAHLLFNVFGVVWVLIVFYPFVDMVCSMACYNPAMVGQTERLSVVLALFHTCFNVLNTAILLGFVPQMERLVCRLLPDGKQTKTENSLHFITAGLMQTPDVGLSVLKVPCSSVLANSTICLIPLYRRF